MNKEYICIRKYRDFEINEIVDFIPRSKSTLKTELNDDFPIGAIFKNKSFVFIYHSDLRYNFATVN